MLSEQQNLIAAIFSGHNSSDYDNRGLSVYRRNLIASGNRALAISFPTVVQLIGEKMFRYATEQLLIISPPDKGDWGLWGVGFADLLEHIPELESYPYIGDCARLDYALHLSRRVLAPRFNVDTLELLGTESLEYLTIKISNNVSILISNYPIVDIWLAHHGEHSLRKCYLNSSREKIQQKIGQSALLYSDEYRPRVREIRPTEQKWIDLLENNVNLSRSLDIISNTEFSFENWLPMAISQNLIKEISVEALSSF